MKLILKSLMMVSVLSIMSCCTDEIHMNQQVEVKNTFSHNTSIRTVKEAVEIVVNNYGNIFDKGTSRSGINVDMENVLAFGSVGDSRSTHSDTALYVVNFEENKGYAIVSANKGCTPLLAMTDNGNLKDIDGVSNPGLKSFIKASIAYNSSLKPIYPDIPVEKYRFLYIVRDTAYRNIEPKAKMFWGQQWPLGYFCPNKTAGCVPTAAALALSYFGYPKNIKLTYPDRDCDEQTMDWPLIRECIISGMFEPFNKPNEAEHYALARFCRELGHRIKVDYTSILSGTKGSNKKMRNLISQIAPEVGVSDYYLGVPNISGLSNWDIVIMGGENPDDPEDAHTWIIDGYKMMLETQYDYSLPDYVLFPDKYIAENGIVPFNVGHNLFYSLSHINWGLNGKDNGYYDTGVYDFTKCKEYDMYVLSGANLNYQNVHEYFVLYKK